MDQYWYVHWALIASFGTVAKLLADINPLIYAGQIATTTLQKVYPHPITTAVRLAHIACVWYWANTVKYDKTKKDGHLLMQTILVGLTTTMCTGWSHNYIYMHAAVIVAAVTTIHTNNYAFLTMEHVVAMLVAAEKKWSQWPFVLAFWMFSMLFVVVNERRERAARARAAAAIADEEV